ncbi:MAG: response regulator [Myxococcota bacterium]|jgi:DNA-binding response OmpR family regulator|nr:response regulator [Myxococcota bacterium]
MKDGKHVILCVDDDADLLESMRLVLEGNGYAMVAAPSAEEGLVKFKEVSPDLIIVDLMMEEIDAGTGLVKNLAAAGNKVPVYMLSSMGDQLSIITDYAALGLSGVFQKPIQIDVLLKTLKSKLG